LAIVAVEIRIANTSGPDVQASAGMYAWGDGLLTVKLSLTPDGAKAGEKGVHSAATLLGQPYALDV